MSEIKHRVIIIGSGPAGLTAALYASRANLSPLVIAGREPGGQLMLTSLVENWPGTKDGIMGPELMTNMIDQAKKFGGQIIFDVVSKVDFSTQPLKVFVGENIYETPAVIITTGAAAVWLGLPGEKELIGKGVSSCANCDAAFFKDKVTAVVGGGDAACEDALALTKFAKSVDVYVRADSFKASKIMTERVLSHEKITVHFNTEIKKLLGTDKLTGVVIVDNKTNQEQEVAIEGLFVAIGHRPATDIFNGQVELDQKGFVKKLDNMKTSVPGVFVAGDVADYRYRQAITAAGDGCRAALEAEWYLEKRH